MFNKLFKLAY